MKNRANRKDRKNSNEAIREQEIKTEEMILIIPISEEKDLISPRKTSHRMQAVKKVNYRIKRQWNRLLRKNLKKRSPMRISFGFLF